MSVEILEEEKKIREMISSLKKTMIQNAEKEWKLSYGAYSPNINQIGYTVIIPSFLAPLERWEEICTDGMENPEIVKTCSYRQEFTHGRHVIFQGRNETGRIPRNIRIGFYGMCFIYHGKKAPLKSFDFRIGDTTYPKIFNIPNRLNIIFTQGYEIKEKTRFIVYGDFPIKRKRYLRAIPIGFCLYKVKTNE